MKDVEIVRTYTVRCMQHALVRLRLLLSTLGTEATPMVDRLHGKEGDQVVAAATDTVMAELGHVTLSSMSDDPGERGRSPTRRAVRGG